MLIKKISPLTGKENSLDINITQEQFNDWNNGELIQVAMPNINPEEREFLISGLLPEEFDELFSEEDEPDLEDYEPVF